MVKENKEKDGIKVTYKELNNKSRKGLYAYVKEPKKAGRYYKVKDDVGKDDSSYLIIYNTGGIKSKKGVTKKAVDFRKSVIQKSRGLPKIEETLRSGYARTTIENANKLTPYTDRIAYKSLLMNRDKVSDGKPMIMTKDAFLSKTVLDMLSLPENIEKWKFRIGYKIQLIDQNNEVMASLIPENIKTLSDIRREVIGSVILGQEFSTMYKDLGEKAKMFNYKLNTKSIKKGRITKINIQMTYKKS